MKYFSKNNKLISFTIGLVAIASLGITGFPKVALAQTVVSSYNKDYVSNTSSNVHHGFLTDRFTDNYDTVTGLHSGSVQFGGNEVSGNGIGPMGQPDCDWSEKVYSFDSYTVKDTNNAIIATGTGANPSWSNKTGAIVASVNIHVVYHTDYYINDGGGGCYQTGGGQQTYDDLRLIVQDFDLSCSPASVTMAQGSSTSFNISTSPLNGFSQPVTFSAPSFSPNSGTLPTVSLTNNGKVPAAVTTANISSTTFTTPGTYTLTFSGTGGGKTHTCNVQLIVARDAGYSLYITPLNLNVMKANQAVYTVSGYCPFTGSSISNLTAILPAEFSGLTYHFETTFGSPPTVVTSVYCWGQVKLVIDNTGSIPTDKLSTPQQQIQRVLVVTGVGN